MELLEYFWNQLDPGETEDLRVASDKSLENAYQRGLIEARKFTLSQWKGACQKFAKTKGSYRFKREDLETLSNYFFQGEIKKPFEPERLKEGPRPLDWTNELYQKVFRFETTLTMEAWRKFVQTHITPHFKKGDSLIYNAKFREVLATLLKQNASPLRRLELWYHFEREQEEAGDESKAKRSAEAPAKQAEPVVIRDAFVAKPDETIKRTAIDKLYFHHNEAPGTTDKDNLDFLDELATREGLEGEEEDDL